MLKFGFDIGITSIGWAVVNTGENDNEFTIVDCGVRLFDAGETKTKNGYVSNSLDYRTARSTRRRLWRRKVRLYAIKQMLCKEFALSMDDFAMQGKKLPKIFMTDKNIKSPWELRKLALKQKLEINELARVILHIAKHRDYDDERYPLVISEKTKDNDDKEKAKKAIQNNIKEVEAYQSGAVMLLAKLENGEIKSLRNKAQSKDGKKEPIYTNSLSQSMNKKELNSILEKQQKDYGYKFSENFCDKLIEIIFTSKDLQDFEDKVGNCTFIENEKRAPKYTPMAQEFIAISKIINTLINVDNADIEINKEIIEKILQKAKSQKTFSYKNLVDLLGLEPYQIKGSRKPDLSDTFIDFEKYNEFTAICREKFGDDFCKVENDTFNDIARICTYKKDFKSLKSAFNEKQYDFSDKQIEKLFALKFSQNINLSLKALQKILPYMRNGLRYDEACQKESLEPITEQKSKFLPPLCDTHFATELTNQVVNRAISQYRKVLNTIIKNTVCQMKFISNLQEKPKKVKKKKTT